MDERIEKWLHDIRFAIEEIEGFFNQYEKTFVEFQCNVVVKRAIERNLEIIGEAVNRVLTKDPDFPIEHARKIVGLRNFIIHAYDSVSDENIWAIVMNDVPKLKEDINRLI